MQVRTDEQFLQLSIFLLIHRDIGFQDIESHFTYDKYVRQYNCMAVYPGYHLDSEITYILHLVLESLSKYIDFDKGYISIDIHGNVSLYGKFESAIYEESKLLITKQHITDLWKEEVYF